MTRMREPERDDEESCANPGLDFVDVLARQ